MAGYQAVADPCACAAMCPHDERCLAGHANYPDSHWYRCTDCTPLRATLYILRDGRHLAVMTHCGHAVGPQNARDIVTAYLDHHRTCRQGIA